MCLKPEKCSKFVFGAHLGLKTPKTFNMFNISLVLSTFLSVRPKSLTIFKHVLSTCKKGSKPRNVKKGGAFELLTLSSFLPPLSLFFNIYIYLSLSLSPSLSLYIYIYISLSSLFSFSFSFLLPFLFSYSFSCSVSLPISLSLSFSCSFSFS